MFHFFFPFNPQITEFWVCCQLYMRKRNSVLPNLTHFFLRKESKPLKLGLLFGKHISHPFQGLFKGRDLTQVQSHKVEFLPLNHKHFVEFKCSQIHFISFSQGICSIIKNKINSSGRAYWVHPCVYVHVCAWGFTFGFYIYVGFIFGLRLFILPLDHSKWNCLWSFSFP